MEKPLLIAEITKIGEDLTGRGIVNGKSYAFRYTKPGDEVHFRFLGRGKRRYNKIEEIRIGSDRSSVECEYFGRCGGCSGQHIPYAEQFELKTSRLENLYQTHWDIPLKKIPAKTIYHYRNRMDFSIFPGNFGLREAGNFRKLVDLESCLIQSDWANQEWKKLRGYLKDHPELPQDRKSELGSLKYITLRKATGTNDTMVILTWDESREGSPEEKAMESWLLRESTASHIVFCYTPRLSEVSAAGRYRTVRGESFYREVVNGQTFHVPFDSFFQPNPPQFRPILDCLDRWLVESQADSLLDLFSGSGFFSLLFGHRVDSILGWDSFAPSIATANHLVREKYPDKRVQFTAVDLFQKKYLPTFLETLAASEVTPESSFLILDPPRNGAGSVVVDWILESGIQKVAYVSCNPYKQWDEIMGELGKKYIPVEAMVTDPYPHTPHLESVVLLQKKKEINFF